MTDLIDLPDFGDPSTLDHSTQGWKALVVIVVCTALVTICVALRTYARRVLLNELWIDDYLAIASTIMLIAQAVLEGIQVRDGVGTHLWDLLLIEGGLIRYQKENWIGMLVYGTTSVFVKLMFFFQYYRIVRNVPRLKLIYSVIMTSIALWCISQILVTVFTCIPIEGLWDTTVNAVCNPIGPDAQFYMASVGNIVTDIIILLLPIPVVWKLKLRKPQKVVLLVVFGIGFFTCFISAFRLIFLRKPEDFTWDAIAVLCWSHAELSSGIVCATIPTLKPLFSKYFPSIGTTRQSSNGYRKYEYGSKGKDSNIPRSTNLSKKDTGIYGLTDLEIGQDQPHPVRTDTGGSRITKHSPKTSLRFATHGIPLACLEDSTDDISIDDKPRQPPRSGRQSSHEIHVQRGWSLSSYKL